MMQGHWSLLQTSTLQNLLAPGQYVCTGHRLQMSPFCWQQPTLQRGKRQRIFPYRRDWAWPCDLLWLIEHQQRWYGMKPRPSEALWVSTYLFELLPFTLEECDPLVAWSNVDNNRRVEQTGSNLKFRVSMSPGGWDTHCEWKKKTTNQKVVESLERGGDLFYTLLWQQLTVT